MTDLTAATPDRLHAAAAPRVQLRYQSGLGNELATEAVPGALPVGQNSPQRPPFDLVSEMASGTTFSAPRSVNGRTYTFRIRPSVISGRFEEIDRGAFCTPPFDTPVNPNYYAWGPFNGGVEGAVDFVGGITTLCGNGSPLTQSGMAMHVFLANTDMTDRVFANADGEMLIIPHVGRLRLTTELGVLEAGLGDLVVVPRGIKFRVEVLGPVAGGFVAENYGQPLRLPELGLIGSNGLANAADFDIPTAAFEDSDRPTQLLHKYGGRMWTTTLAHSPLDVVAWRGSYYPYKFDMHRFVTIGTLSVDHPDPSIHTVLTSPSDPILGPNMDVMAVTPHWIVAERSFRPPGFHRNAICEIVLLLQGMFGSLAPGSMTMTGAWVPHGPEVDVYEFGRSEEQVPVKAEDMLLMVIESRFPMQVSPFGEAANELIADYGRNWEGLPRGFPTR